MTANKWTHVILAKELVAGDHILGVAGDHILGATSIGDADWTDWTDGGISTYVVNKVLSIVEDSVRYTLTINGRLLTTSFNLSANRNQLRIIRKSFRFITDYPGNCTRCGRPAYVGSFEVDHYDEIAAKDCPARRK